MDHLLCHNIVWVQVPPCSLIDSFHWKGQFHLVTTNLWTKQSTNQQTSQTKAFCGWMCHFTSLPMTLIHTCSPTSTISEAFSTREADISLTCTRPVMCHEKTQQLSSKIIQNNKKSALLGFTEKYMCSFSFWQDLIDDLQQLQLMLACKIISGYKKARI